MAKIEAKSREGLSHGHFDFSISCKIANSGKRELLVRPRNTGFSSESELQQSA
jgi:hypothetical protein